MSDEKRDVKEVRTVRNDEEANGLLAAGWVLLGTGTSHVDDMGYNAKVHFILGKVETKNQEAAT